MGETQVLDGRYRLEGRLGGGGMSVVWRAYDEVLDRYVAVKVLAAARANWTRSRGRIRAEAQAAARLSHPHVTAVHDYGESADDTGERVPYVVMELLTGLTLAERLASGPVPARDALRTCAEVATALAAAHAHGLVHRDIKPANVMLTPAGAKVLDFGIAAAAGDGGESAADGLVWGTPAYVAPERLTGGEVAPAADVYALGLVLYRSLAGTPPWPAESVPDILAAHLSEPPALLPLAVGVPAKVATLCHQCLAKDPEQRPTAHEVATVLAAAGGWRVVAAPGGGDILADGLAVLPAADRVRRRARAALAAARSGIRPARAARLAGATVVIVATGVLAGWGLSDEPGNQWRPGGPEAAPAVPQVDPSGGPQTAPPGTGPGATGGDVPPQYGIAGATDTSGGLGTGGGTGSDLGSGSGTGASDGGTGQGSDTGDDSGGGTDTPAPAPTTAAPAPKPTPKPSPTTPAVVEQTRTLLTTGGTIVVRCVGSTAEILSVSPLAGFGIAEIDRGPAAVVGVRLNALLVSVGVTVRCVSGVPDASIEIG